jgi:hypothetical protein
MKKDREKTLDVRKDGKDSDTIGEMGSRRSTSLLSELSGPYFLSLFLKRPPRPRDFLGTETRAKWLTEPSESEDLVNGGRRAAVVSLDHREFMVVGSGLKESCKNNLLSSSDSTFTASLVTGPGGTIFKGGGAGFLCFLGTLRLRLLWRLAGPDVELEPTTNRVTRPGLRG